MLRPSTQSFTGFDVSMDNAIITLPTVCQGIHKQNFSCGFLSAESTIPKQSMANCPVIMKSLYAGSGIWINLSPVMLNWETGTVTALSRAFTDSKIVHLAWPSWGMWINNKQMNNFKEFHTVLPMDTGSLAWSFSSSFTVNVNIGNRQSQQFTFYFNKRP